MTHNIAKIRAALNLYDRLDDSYTGWAEVFEGAYAALAELEKASGRSSARMSWEICGCQTPPTHYVGTMPCPLNPTPPPVKPAPQFVAGVVTDDVAARVLTHFSNFPVRLSNAQNGHDMIAAVRSGLGPALGMVEIREPSDDECADIHQEWLNAHGIQGYGAVQNGRAMFNSVRAVMWPKEGL